VYKLLRRSYAVLKAYVLSDLVRSKGFIYGSVSLALWITMFIAPMSLFMGREVDPSRAAAYGFTAVMIFLAYSAATWDWGAELRWLINSGVFEYYIASNSGFVAHYLGILPVSLMWVGAALAGNYLVLTLVFGPPALSVHDPLALVAGLGMLISVLVGYGLLLGGTLISTGSAGFLLEILTFILPIATGGLTPLSRLPKPFQLFALSTPFSYPAELVRYAMLGLEPVTPLHQLVAIGYPYALAFLFLGALYFKTQLRRILKEGVKPASLW